MPVYPEGIRRMNDYIGRQVAANMRIKLRNGNVIERDYLGTVVSHYRGKLVIRFNAGFTGRQIRRNDVRLV